MAKSWQYPRWRRYAMQAVMWVVLGVTVAMAALVNHARRQSLRVDLAPPVTSGNVSVRLPAAWQVAQPIPGDAHSSGRLIARAIEPATDANPSKSPAGRMVTVYLDRVDAPISPIQYLLDREGLAEVVAVAQNGAAAQSAEALLPFTPIPVGDFPGVMVISTRTPHNPRVRNSASPSNPSGVRKELLACTILPSRQALVLKLEGPGEPEPADSEILEQLAAAVEIAGEPSRGASGESVALPGGIRIRMPDEMIPVYDNDPDRTERLAWFEGDAGAWLTAELIPCVLLPDGSGDDERRAVATIVATHDPELSRATVSADGPRRWRIEPPVTPLSPVAPRRLYLLGDDRGDGGQISGGPRRALLAVFYGVSGSEHRFDARWNAVVEGVEFVGETDYSSMLAAGEAEAQRLMRTGLAALAEPQPRGEAWWMFVNDASKTSIGWSQITWDAAAPLGRRRGQWVRQSGTQHLRFTQSWDGAMEAYRCLTEMTSFSPAGITLTNQLTTLTDGELKTELSQPRRKPVAWKRLAPPQYVPGAWLSLLIGQLRTDRPLILRTDCIAGFEGISPPEPMTLLISFPTPPQSPAPASPAAVPQPSRRIVSVQVNGSGQVMSWHVTQDGSVDRIDLAGGAQRVRSDEQTIRNNFDNVDDPADSLH